MDPEKGKRKDKEKNWSQQKLEGIPSVQRESLGIYSEKLTALFSMVTFKEVP